MLSPQDVAVTAQKMKFSIKDFFSKWDQIRSFLRIWPHLLKKSFKEIFIFCNVCCSNYDLCLYIINIGKNLLQVSKKDFRAALSTIFSGYTISHLEYVFVYKGIRQATQITACTLRK